MRTIPSVCLALALLGCPTPPDGGTQGGPVNAPAAGGGGDAPPPPQGAGADGGPPVESPPEADPNAASGTYVVTQLPTDEAAPPEGDQPTSEQAQAAIKASDHVLFKGEIKCDDCSGNMLVKVAPFVQPTEDDPEAGKAVEPADESGFQPPAFETSPGPFTMAVPRYRGKVVLEVLDDRDGNGSPSRGEKFTVLHNQGKITAGKNQSGLVVDFSGLPGAPGGAPGGPAGGPPPAAPGSEVPAGGPPPQ